MTYFDELLTRLGFTPPQHVCVCGHPQQDHRGTVLSVPLTRDGEALYKVGNAAPSMMYDRRNGSTASVECHCGCCAFTPDDNQTDWRNW